MSSGTRHFNYITYLLAICNALILFPLLLLRRKRNAKVSILNHCCCFPDESIVIKKKREYRMNVPGKKCLVTLYMGNDKIFMKSCVYIFLKTMHVSSELH